MGEEDMSRKICSTPGCSKRAVMHKTKCAACRSALYKEHHPFRYYFNLHKQKAKQRKIPWELTIDQFREIWINSGKWEAKLAGGDWQMDRKDVNKGYVKGNIQIIKKQLNIEKFWQEDRFHIDFAWVAMWSERNELPVEECPF